MKTNEIEVNEQQIKAAWKLIQIRLEYAKESLELIDTASAINSIECVLALMSIMQGDIEDAPDELDTLDNFVQKIVNDCYPVKGHKIHNPAFIKRKDACEACGFLKRHDSRFCDYCQSAGGNGQ